MPAGGRFGRIGVGDGCVNSRVVPACSCVAGSASYALKGIAAWGEVGAADKTRCVAREECGTEEMAVNACLCGGQAFDTVGVCELTPVRV